MCISGCAASVAARGCVTQYSFHKRGTNLWEGRFFTRSLAERPSGNVHRTSSRCRGIQPLRSKMIGSYFGRKMDMERNRDICSLGRRQSQLRRYNIRGQTLYISCVAMPSGERSQSFNTNSAKRNSIDHLHWRSTTSPAIKGRYGCRQQKCVIRD